MLDLTEIIRPNDPSMQRWCRAVEDARALTALILATWKFTRVLAVDIVEGSVTDSCATASVVARSFCPFLHVSEVRIMSNKSAPCARVKHAGVHGKMQYYKSQGQDEHNIPAP